MPTPRTIKVFIASPGDLAVERRAFKDVLEKLNGDSGDALNITFEPLGWEDTLAVIRPRSQETINQDIDRCDVFILAMNRRWGQDAPEAKPYSSYTEEEFHRAFSRWKTKPKGKKLQAPEIFVFFKHIDPASMGDPGPQLQKVLEFRKQLEESRQVLYHGFADEAEFKVEVDRHLRAFAKGELPKADAPRDKVLLPLEVLAEVQKERAETKKEFDRAEMFALEFAERASKAALEGRVEEARHDFAKATEGTANLDVLFLAIEFYYRTGDLTSAEELLHRSLAINGPDAQSDVASTAISNLGLIYQTQGKLDQAEEMHRKALAIDEKLDRRQGLASVYGNLGLIHQMRGELDEAEAMLLKALEIQKELGLDEYIANQYGNLGGIYQTRGDLDLAEEMHWKSLEIDVKLGRHEGIARQYGNLGAIYYALNNLDGAEEMIQLALNINKKLGRKEGMAHQYANLGRLANDRCDFDGARELWTKARDLYTKIGMPHMVKQMQEWLDR